MGIENTKLFSEVQPGSGEVCFVYRYDPFFADYPTYPTVFVYKGNTWERFYHSCTPHPTDRWAVQRSPYQVMLDTLTTTKED